MGSLNSLRASLAHAYSFRCMLTSERGSNGQRLFDEVFSGSGSLQVFKTSDSDWKLESQGLSCHWRCSTSCKTVTVTTCEHRNQGFVPMSDDLCAALTYLRDRIVLGDARKKVWVLCLIIPVDFCCDGSRKTWIRKWSLPSTLRARNGFIYELKALAAARGVLNLCMHPIAAHRLGAFLGQCSPTSLIKSSSSSPLLQILLSDLTSFSFAMT